VTPPPDDLHALDDALRRSVEERVESLLARARRDAAARVERAQQEADADARRARAEGEATAALILERENARMRRDSATIVLDAKRAALRELRDRVHEAVRGLRAEPDYDDLLDGLTARARARLGSDAQVIRDPADVGGIIAEQAGQRLDYTLPALADRALAGLGEAIEDLWPHE
jgi:vacuolar-type H+-ATPase subunit E/Vma4